MRKINGFEKRQSSQQNKKVKHKRKQNRYENMGPHSARPSSAEALKDPNARYISSFPISFPSP
jgi:hypothetical protein